MTTPDFHHHHVEPSLSAVALERLLVVVEAFDRAWRDGSPRLEDHLNRLGLDDAASVGTERAAWQRALFRELLAVEIEYRRERGETPEPAEYLPRFPRELELIEVAFQTEWEVGASEFISPRLIGEYRIERELGRGGMGVVYLVRRMQQGDLAALKLLLPSDEFNRAVRFRREARAASRIVSDHVVKIYDVGEYAGQPYFVMPFVEGGSLLDLLKTGPLDGRRAARLLEPIARALHALHREGVLHRDLKPSNILYDSTHDRALLTDFGLAKFEQSEREVATVEQAGAVDGVANASGVFRATAVELTQAGSAFGTLSYMAPEQTFDAGEVTVAAEVYGLGATLYHLLCGLPPFRAQRLDELIGLIRAGNPRPLRSIHPTVSLDLEAICRRCLERDAVRRYHSSRELADELQAFLDGRPVQARPVSKAVHAVRWCQRNRWGTALMAVMLLASITTSVMSWQMWRSTNRERETNRQLTQKTGELQQEFQKSTLLANEAEGGQYDLMLEQFRQAQRVGRHGEVLHHPKVIVPASQTGWELRRLKYEALLLSPQLVSQLGEHDAPVLDAVRSPDGRWLVSCGAEGLVMLWNLQTNREERVLLNGRWRESKRRRLHEFTEWELADPSQPNPPKMTWPPPQLCPVDLEWLGETSRLAAASLDGQGLLIDVVSGETRLLLRDTDALECVATTADGAQVLFGGRSGCLSLCDVRDSATPPTTRQLDSPPVTLKFVERVGWLIGCEDGRLLLLDPLRIVTLAETTLPGPVWSFDAVAIEDRIEIVVGSQQPRSRLYEIALADASAPRLVEVGEIPADEAVVSAIHSVRFGATGREVCSVDQQGRAFVFSRDERRLRWATAPFREQALRQQADAAAARGWPYPRSFERAGVIADFREVPPRPDVPGGDGSRDEAAREWEAIVCTPEAVVRRYRWRDSLRTNDVPGRITRQLPAEPRIAFDPQRPNQLWCLSGDGHLTRMDVTDGRMLQSAVAHSGTGHALVPIPRDHPATALGEVLTAAEDGVLQTWRCDSEQQLVPGAFRLTHDRPLLSAALCPTEPLVASVDDTATLLIWNLPSGRIVHRHKLSESSRRPETGRVEFDPTGRWLAAFGSGEELALFQLQPFAPYFMPTLDIHGWGTALLWNPRAPDTLVAADGQRRLLVRNVAQKSIVTNQFGYWNQPCVAMCATSDHRRLLLLLRDGRVEVVDARRHRLLQTIGQKADAEPNEARDLAYDPTGDRVAVAFRDGTLHVWESQRPDPPAGVKVESVEGEWESKDLLTTLFPQFQASPRATVSDAQGHVSLLVLRGRQSFEELVYLDETDNGVREEIIEVGQLEHSGSAVALVRESHGQPVAIYRGGHDPHDAKRGKFDFDLRVVRRIGGEANGVPAKWLREATGVIGNVGRYPCPVLREGRLERVLSLREADYLLQQVPVAAQGWGATESLGRQGDGVGLMVNADGREPLFGFNARPGGTVQSIPHVGWFDVAGWQREVFDPTANNILSVARLPDGSPLVLADRSGEKILARRVGRNEWTYEPVPGRDPGSLTCDARGRIRLLNHDAAQGMLLLCERGELNAHGQRVWTQTVVARNLETQIGWATLRLTEDQQPVVVSSNPISGRPGIRVFRLRSSLQR